jgi:hypothetical protein
LVYLEKEVPREHLVPRVIRVTLVDEESLARTERTANRVK